MKVRNFASLLLTLLTFVVFGCGTDGGGPGGTQVSGSAVKGPVSGATVQAFEIISSASAPRTNIPRIGTTVLATGTTAADGSFSFAIPSTLKNGGVLFKLTGGQYKDEATGATVQLNTQAANGLRAVFGNISGAVRRGETLNVSITPLTELGFQALGAAAPTDANIAAANAQVVTTFGLTGVDILKTKPFDATTAPPTGATQAQKDYSLVLAVLSQVQKERVNTLDQLNTSLLPDVNAGALSPANDTAGSIALLNFLNSGNNKSGGTVDPVTVTVTPASARTAVINSSVTITATVQQGGGNVPDGTEVKFAIKSGAGGALSAATAVTTGGVASVTLTSPTDTAAYVVTATAGGTPADSALITFADPNKPGSIALAAVPATGVIGGQTPVTLTATVTPADPVNGVIANGTPVTFTILTGTGALTAATTTTNGVASVTLNSTAVGTVTVNATAGTAPVVTSNTASVPFIAQPTTVIVKLRTTGTLPVNTTIGGVNAIASAAPSSGLSITTGNVSATGAGVGSTLVANTANVAAVNLALINTGGIQVGEFATLTYSIAVGTFPVAGNFNTALIGAGVIDTNGANIPGIAVSVLSVTIQ